MLNPRDQLHDQALAISRSPGAKILTTRWILLELANAMSNPPDRTTFVSFTRKLATIDTVKILPANEDWLTIGLHLYRLRPDKA